jgi:tetratricopeptide (TPR) repeat protein/transcriptional regulator with XRE-family HTH domain
LPAHGSARRERLAARRKALGLTQEALADLLAVERSTVVRWERGGTEPLPWIRPKLAKALRVPADRVEELLAKRVQPGATPGAAAYPDAGGAPRQLPAAVADFTGRAAEMRALTQIVDDAGADPPAGTGICAIGAAAGTGKSALALHWAHQVAHRFPDGQLHVNLRGFDPSGALATPAEAIRGFLDVLGVPPQRIPRLPDAQAALYRSLLADRRMLILLDNARDEAQVRPLLPASPGSLILVTSRNQLVGLAAADGARLLTLGVLTHEEAVRLLTARIGPRRAAAEPDAVARIAGLCAYLPLALVVAAARAAARPGFPLAALAAELADPVGRLDTLDAGDPAASVRAVFSWSYEQLGAESARIFRLLGLHPGPDISVPAAASLAATGVPEARRMLRQLARAHLVIEHVPGRYAFHDLLRVYAAERSRQTDSEPERTAAIGRVLDHYLHTAAGAVLSLHPAIEPIAIAPPRPGTTAELLADHRHARAWFEGEHRVLLAAVTLAAQSGFDSHAWQLPWAIGDFFYSRGSWSEGLAIRRTALAAATRLGDGAGQAVSGRLLGNAFNTLGEYDRALGHYMASFELYRRLGDRLGEALVQQNLSLLAERQGRFADALHHAEQAFRLLRADGGKAMQAAALSNVGWCHALLGDYVQARAFCRQALALHAKAGLPTDEHYIWDRLGYAEHHLGNFAEAVGCYRRALGISRKFGDRLAEANILAHLGHACLAAGELPQARQAWQKALTIFEDLDHPDGDKVRSELASVDHQATERSALR